MSALALGANFGFNFFYIYGIPSLRFDGLGFVGSPFATSSSTWFRFIALVVYDVTLCTQQLYCT
jgi:Na+-driven multidrug efflux pump